MEARFGFFVRMVEGRDGYGLILGDPIEIVVVELAHFSAFAFFLLKELLLNKFKAPFVKQFLAFVRPFRFLLSFLLHML